METEYTPPKILIIFDSNKIRSMIYGGLRYDVFDFGLDFTKIKRDIVENNLSEYITLAIPELVLDELVHQKIDQYRGDIKEFPRIKERLCKLPCSDFGKIVLPDETFECSKHLLPLIKNFLKDNNVEIIEVKEKDKRKMFDRLLNRAKEGEPPFKGKILNEKTKNSDAGFKDTVIWETIINWNKLKKFDNIFFMCGDEGFKVQEEIDKIFNGKNFKILGDFEILRSTLKGISSDIELNLYFCSKDFSARFKKYLEDNYNQKIKRFRLDWLSLEVKDAIFQDLEDIGIEEYYGDRLERIKIANFVFTSDGEKFTGEAIIEKNNKEVIFARSSIP